MHTTEKTIKEGDVTYTYKGWYGCVLESTEKRDIRKGDMRFIADTLFYAYTVRKKLLSRKREVSWLIATPGRDIRQDVIDAFRERVFN